MKALKGIRGRPARTWKDKTRQSHLAPLTARQKLLAEKYCPTAVRAAGAVLRDAFYHRFHDEVVSEAFYQLVALARRDRLEIFTAERLVFTLLVRSVRWAIRRLAARRFEFSGADDAAEPVFHQILTPESPTDFVENRDYLHHVLRTFPESERELLTAWILRGETIGQVDRNRLIIKLRRHFRQHGSAIPVKLPSDTPRKTPRAVTPEG